MEEARINTINKWFNARKTGNIYEVASCLSDDVRVKDKDRVIEGKDAMVQHYSNHWMNPHIHLINIESTTTEGLYAAHLNDGRQFRIGFYDADDEKITDISFLVESPVKTEDPFTTFLNRVFCSQ